MTISEIQSLREEKPRKFDAIVSIKIHGWKFGKHGGHGAYWKDGIGKDMMMCPRYHSDANADLLSHRVACGWIFSKRQRYFFKLDEVLQNRFGKCVKEDWSRVAWPNVLSKFEVGDWSMCALATVMEDSAKGEGK